MAAGVWRAGRWYPDGWEWDSDEPPERDHGHRVRLVRVPYPPHRDGSPSDRFLVSVRVRPEDPDPDRVRAVLRMLADQDVVRVTRNLANEAVFVLAGPSLTADAITLHAAVDLLPGWPLEPEPAEPPPDAPPSPPTPPASEPDSPGPRPRRPVPPPPPGLLSLRRKGR